ncbi:MAG TPA: AzlD domain-containing protein [Solirubrobacteraceae bacterium]|nr:AzlD domain-containing protein [Solirubrobacteraceae bacterium]
MSTLWLTIVVASVACYGLKLAGVSLPESVMNHPRIQRIAGLLPIAMLSALVVSDLFDSNRHYAANGPTVAGVAAGAIALWRGKSLIVVFLVAIAVSALLRAIV